MERKLYRSRKNQMIAGVCGGLAEYLDIDPTVVRALLAILAVFGGGGVLLYIVLMIVIPLTPEENTGSAETVVSEPIAPQAEVETKVKVETQPAEENESPA